MVEKKGILKRRWLVYCNMETEWKDILQAAEYLKVSTAIVNRFCFMQDFPAAKVGRRWRIRQDLLDKWWLERFDDKPMNI